MRPLPRDPLSSMPNITQSQLTFQSGGKAIASTHSFPRTTAISCLRSLRFHGAGGDGTGWINRPRFSPSRDSRCNVLIISTAPLRSLPTKGDYPSHFPIWMKTLWDAISFRSRASRPWIASASRCSAFRWALISRWRMASIDQRVQAVVEFFGASRAR